MGCGWLRGRGVPSFGGVIETRICSGEEICVRMKALALALGAAAMSWASGTAYAQVAQESGYQLVYKLDIGSIPYTGGAATFDSTGVPYSVNNAGSITPGSFGRVAYMLTLSGSTSA